MNHERIQALVYEMGVDASTWRSSVEAVEILYRKLQHGLTYIESFPDELRLLDIACGSLESDFPPILAEMFGRLGAHVVGVDRGNAIAGWENYIHRQADILREPIASVTEGEFDAISFLNWSQSPAFLTGMRELSTTNDSEALKELELSILLQARGLLVSGGLLYLESILHQDRLFFRRSDTGDMILLETDALIT